MLRIYAEDTYDAHDLYDLIDLPAEIAQINRSAATDKPIFTH